VRGGSQRPTVRIGTMQAVPEVLRRLGADPPQVLAEAGIDPGLFDNPDNRISLAARGRLFSRCVASTGCRHFGLLVGQQARLNSFGLVGLLAKYSPDVGTALRSLVRFFHLHNRGATIELAVAGDRTTFRPGPLGPTGRIGCRSVGDVAGESTADLPYLSEEAGPRALRKALGGKIGVPQSNVKGDRNADSDGIGQA